MAHSLWRARPLVRWSVDDYCLLIFGRFRCPGGPCSCRSIDPVRSFFPPGGVPWLFKQKRHYNKNPQRRKVPGVGAETMLTRRQPPPIVSTTPVASTCVVVFAVPVILNGVPRWSSSAVDADRCHHQREPRHCHTYVHCPASGADIEVLFEDPAIRTNSGGYVPPQTITLP